MAVVINDDPGDNSITMTSLGCQIHKHDLTV